MFKFLFVAVLLGQVGSWPDRCRDRTDGRTRMCENTAGTGNGTPAQFEFATSSGVGMTEECAGTAITGTKGETITFTRASANGTCIKGNVNSIANGDLVKLTTNQPRVMRGLTGTGDRGLLRERSSVNFDIRSEEFDNAIWLKTSCTAGKDATVTADFAVGPDGTTTAERVQLQATSSAQSSCISQASATGAAKSSGLVFIKGNGTSGTLNMALYTGAGGTLEPVDCTYNATTWTPCVFNNGGSGGVTTIHYIGNLGGFKAAPVANSAADVLMWGGQLEQATFSSSYIPTVAASVTRAGDSATVTGYSYSNSTISISATTIPTTITAAAQSFAFFVDSSNIIFGGDANTGGPFNATFRQGGVDSTVSTAGSVVAGAANNVAIYYDGAVRGACIAGVCATTAGVITLASGTGTLRIGGSGGGAAGSLNGIIKNFCLDPSPTRCR